MVAVATPVRQLTPADFGLTAWPDPKRMHCLVEGCETRARNTGRVCGKHWARWKRRGDFHTTKMSLARERICATDGCGRLVWPHGRRGLCTGCVDGAAVRSICAAPDCSRRSKFRLCKEHRGKFVIKCSYRPPAPRRYVTPEGYVMVTRHENGTGRERRIFEHRVVMAEHLGRPLLSSENVHHINGVKSDNRFENLELWSTNQPPGQRVADQVAWARRTLEQYGAMYP